MSVIVVIIDELSLTANAIVAIRKPLGVSIAEVRSAASRVSPIFEREIFDSHFDEHATSLRGLIEAIKTNSLRHRIYELAEGSKFEEGAVIEHCRIDAATLLQILD